MNNNHPFMLNNLFKHRQISMVERRSPISFNAILSTLKLLTANPQFRYRPNSRKFILAVATFTNLEFQFIGVPISSHEWRVHLWYTSDNTTRNVASG